MLGQAVLMAALTIGSGEPVTLGIYVEFDGATYLWNNGKGGWQGFKSYGLSGADVDAAGWKSISDYVAAGDGALVASVLGNARGFLAFRGGNELLEVGFGNLEPGERFYIGKPFRTVPPVNFTASGSQWGEEIVRYELTYDPTVYMPADYNHDGPINLDDFAVLKANFGTGTTRQQGDTNIDGKVDLTDFGMLKENFGKSGSAAVPEPSTFLLAALAGIGLLAFRLRARCRIQA